jgi:uncharacterized secreted protein with C-terminal beta-propeller domain
MGSDSGSGARPILAVAAAGLIIAGCGAGGATSSPHPAPSLRLVAYDDCGGLLRGLREATAAHVGPYGLPGDSMMRPLASGRVPGNAKAVDQAPDTAHSTTNTQEPGIDEPDLVKTDGRRIVTASGGRLHVIDAASRKETGTADLRAGAAWSPGELLLSGDRALVVLRPAITFARDNIGGITDIAPIPRGQGPRLVLVDLKGAPRVVSSLQADGAYVDARLTGSVARLVIRSAPSITFPPPRGGADADATATNRRVVQHAPLDAWLPHYKVTRGGRTASRTVPCDQVSHPASYTGASLVSVLSVDLAGDMADVSPVSVVAGGQTVYGSGTGLYVTDRPATGTPDRTDIYRFDLNGSGPPRFAASGSVPGALLNQYSLSEYAGNLRVATTTGQAPRSWSSPSATPPTESAVYVLARHGGRLEQVGRLGGLGRGERIYAVRFAGPAGYVVTFRQTDPLYALDLRDPARPRATGELKISGYSAYLHPVGDGRLIGVGQQTDAKGRPLGTQVSLFDVSDPAAPRKLSGYTVPSTWSMAEFDPHAFLYWPQSGLVVVPMAGPGKDGALALTSSATAVRRLGEVDPPKSAGAIQRALVVGGTLWTLTPTGLQANDMTTLAKTAWLPFS